MVPNYKQQGDVIVVTATTNHAIQNAARAFLKLVDKLLRGTVVFLQSVAAELQEITIENSSWRTSRLPELLNELLEKTGDTMENPKKRAIQRVLIHYQPMIIFDITVMVTKFADQLTEGYYKVAKLIINEASLLTELNYLSLLLHFLQTRANIPDGQYTTTATIFGQFTRKCQANRTQQLSRKFNRP